MSPESAVRKRLVHTRHSHLVFFRFARRAVDMAASTVLAIEARLAAATREREAVDVRPVAGRALTNTCQPATRCNARTRCMIR